MKLKTSMAPQPLVGEWLDRAGMRLGAARGKKEMGARVQIDIDPQGFM